MFQFAQNGLLVITDSENNAYYFDPYMNLKEVADFIWKQESLKEYTADTDSLRKEVKERIYIEHGTHHISDRLRNFEPLLDDSYYSGQE